MEGRGGGGGGGHKHKIMDRPFKPKYGTVSQVLLQLVVAHCMFMKLAHIITVQQNLYENVEDLFL